MGAPGLKARYVDVYLPSETAKRQWEEDAKEVGLPLSKFVYEAVEAFCLPKRKNLDPTSSKSWLKSKRRFRNFGAS